MANYYLILWIGDQTDINIETLASLVASLSGRPEEIDAAVASILHSYLLSTDTDDL